MKKIVFSILFLVALKVAAQDRVFTTVYQSNVLGQGQKEIEVWNTLRNTSKPNFGRELEQKIEFEMGLGGNVQTAFYLLSTNGAGFNSDTKSIESEQEYGFANEWKWKLSDPVADLIGSALYWEYTIRPIEIELEGKLILDKRVGNTLHALNIAAERSFENSFSTSENKMELEQATKVFYSYGASYRLNENFNIGLEAYNKNKYTKDGWEYSALYVGPTISYATSSYWINLSCLPQVTDLKLGAVDPNSNYKFMTRLLFSYVF